MESVDRDREEERKKEGARERGRDDGDGEGKCGKKYRLSQPLYFKNFIYKDLLKEIDL